MKRTRVNTEHTHHLRHHLLPISKAREHVHLKAFRIETQALKFIPLFFAANHKHNVGGILPIDEANKFAPLLNAKRLILPTRTWAEHQ